MAKTLPDSQVRDRLAQLAELSLDVLPIEVADRFGSSGFVVESVPLAIFSARAIRTKSLETVLTDAILAGGDTDTIASIAGQIAGASVGRAGLPTELIRRLHDKEEIIEIAERFSVRAGAG